MLGKWLMLGGIILAPLVYGSKVQAEGGCPEGYYPIGGGNGGYYGCAPIPDQVPQPNPRPSPGSQQLPPGSKEYGYGYIAVAWHPKATDVWATWNQRTERLATQTVLNACTQAMGEGCGLVINGWNGSAAFVRDQTNGLWKGWGETPKQAREVALQSCKSLRQGCEVVHTFTAKPLKQPKIRTQREYLQFLEDPAFDVSKSYLPGKFNTP